MSERGSVRFKERDVPPYGEPVGSGDLKEGEVYFALQYEDDEMLYPVLEPWIFVGRDLHPGDAGQVYFQDLQSYRAGVRYPAAEVWEIAVPNSMDPPDETAATFQRSAENELGHVFTYEKALDRLLACSIRRAQLHI